jgi:hypothetical protein
MSTLDFETDRDLLAVENKRQPSIQKNEWSAAEIKNFRASFSEEDWVDFLLKLNTNSPSWYREIDTMILDLSEEKIDAILGNLSRQAKLKFVDYYVKSSVNEILLSMSLSQFNQFILEMNQEELTRLIGNSDFYRESEPKLADEKMTSLVKEIKKSFGFNLEENANKENVAEYLAWLKKSQVFEPILFYRNKDVRRIEMAMAATQYGWLKAITEIRDGVPTDMWLKFLEEQTGYRMTPDCLAAATMNSRPDLMRVLRSGVTEEYYSQWSHLVGRSFYITRIPVKDDPQSAETVDLLMEGVSEEDWIRTMDADELVEIIEAENLPLLKKIKSKFVTREKVDGEKQGISTSWSRLVKPSTLRAALISQKSNSAEETPFEKRILILEEIVEGVDSETIKKALLDRESGNLLIKIGGGSLNTTQLTIFRERMSDDDWNTVMLSHHVGINLIFSGNHNTKTLQFILDNTENDVLVQMLNSNSYGKNELPLFFYSKKDAQSVKNKIGKDNWLKVISFKPYGSKQSPIEHAIEEEKWDMLGFLILDLTGDEELESAEEGESNPLKAPAIEALNKAVSVEKLNFFQLSPEQKDIIWKGYSVALELWSALSLPMSTMEDYDRIARAAFTREITMSDAISDEALLNLFVKTASELAKYDEKEATDVNDVIGEIGVRLLTPLAILKIGKSLSNDKLREVTSTSVDIAKIMMAVGDSKISNNSSLPLSVGELLNLSRQWHQNHSTMSREIVDLLDWKEWKSVVGNDESDSVIPSFFEYFVDGQKIGVAVLTDSDLLAQESACLDHCVGRGGYGAKCARGNTHILSIKVFDQVEKKWISSSTVEIDNDLKVIQHKGKGNSKPQKNELQAVKLFIADINSKKLNKTEKTGETPKSLSWAKDLEARLGNDAKFRSIGFVPSVEKVLAVMEHYALLSWKVKKNIDGSVEMRSIFCPKIVSRKIGDTYLHRSNFFVDGSKGRVPMNRQSLVDAIIPILDYWVDILIKRVNKNDDLQLKSLSEVFAAKN